MKPFVGRVMVLAIITAPLALASPVASALATCQGQTATVIGDGINPAQGTPGPDVIVSNGSTVVAGEGNDVICVTGGGDHLVLAEGGNDSILVESASYDTTEITPGLGDDDVVGGSGRDRVRFVDGDDLIELGSGKDEVEVGPAARLTRGVLGGPGADKLSVDVEASTAASTTVLDIAGQRVLRNGTPLATTFDGFERYRIRPGQDGGLVEGVTTVLGSGGPELLEVSQVRNAQVRAGAGDDVVDATPRDGSIDGGAGRDLIASYYAGYDPGYRRLFIDLNAGRLRDPRDPDGGVRIRGFEDAAARYRGATVFGDQRANRLSAPCGRLVGGAGNDRLLVGGYESETGSLLPQICPSLSEGGLGADVLIGSGGKDRLVGGAGTDRADGRARIDTCQAERRIRCERR